jgi:hypothetical protein
MIWPLERLLDSQEILFQRDWQTCGNLTTLGYTESCYKFRNLTVEGSVLTMYTTRFKIQQSYILPI